MPPRQSVSPTARRSNDARRAPAALFVLGAAASGSGGETVVRAAQRRFQRISGHEVLRAFGHRLFVSVDRRRLAMSLVAQPREDGAPVHGDVIGLAALDRVLRRLRARVMFMALVVDVFGMNPDDRAAHPTGLRVPTNPIPHPQPSSHKHSPRRLGRTRGGAIPLRGAPGNAAWVVRQTAALRKGADVSSPPRNGLWRGVPLCIICR